MADTAKEDTEVLPESKPEGGQNEEKGTLEMEVTAESPKAAAVSFDSMEQGSESSESVDEPQQSTTEKDEEKSSEVPGEIILQKEEPENLIGEEVEREYTYQQAMSFLYKAKDSVDREVQETISSLLPEKDGTYTAPMKRQFSVVILSCDDNNEPVRKPDTIDIDYTTCVATFKESDLVIPADKIRFVELFDRALAHTSMYEVNMSLSLDSYTTFHLLGNTLKDTADLLNSLRRLVYENFRKLSAKEEEAKHLIDFLTPNFLGDIAICILKIQGSTEEVQDDGCFEKYHCVLDKECLSMFKSSLETRPIERVYFWQEVDQGSVDKIMVFHETNLLRIQTHSKKIEIKEVHPDFLEALRKAQPLAKETYIGQKGILDYHRLQQMPTRSFARIEQSRGYIPGIYPSSFQDSERKMPAENVRIQTFYDEMTRAEEQFQTVEELSLNWIVAEDEIKSTIQNGLVPETDVLSGGLDPDNVDHFLKSVEGVEDQLKQGNYQQAISRLQGTKKIFAECTYSEMEHLLKNDDISLLRKMYYHSFA